MFQFVQASKTSILRTSTRFYTRNILEPQRCPKIPRTQLFINNEWVNAESGKTIGTVNPTTEGVITEIQAGGKEDVNMAIEAAKEAFKMGPWRKMSPLARCSLIDKLSELMERDIVLLSSLETLECGKIYSFNVRGDVANAIRLIKSNASWAERNTGERMELEANITASTCHQPVGVVAIINAWNFPLLTLCGKLSQALAAGCSVVVKPSQHASLSTLHLGELIKEAGFPPGVINIVTGNSQVGRELVKHRDVDAVVFIGSTEVGKDIYRECAGTVKRMMLELGGKSPNIILQDADIDKAVEHAHYAAFYNMGQCCCAGSRTYVHESIYEKFLQKSIERIKARKIGDPFDPNVEHGPQTTMSQMESVIEMIERGIKEGAKLEIGGKRIEREGYFMEPTMFSEIEDTMRIAQDEIFGPVQLIMPFKTLDEVIERANSTDYGLAASVYGNDVNQINTLAEGINAGSFWVNCYYIMWPHVPFGGFKQSGLGREGGKYGMSHFTEVKAIYIKTDSKIS